jgi:hypothetical protein
LEELSYHNGVEQSWLRWAGFWSGSTEGWRDEGLSREVEKRPTMAEVVHSGRRKVGGGFPSQWRVLGGLKHGVGGIGSIGGGWCKP